MNGPIRSSPGKNKRGEALEDEPAFDLRPGSLAMVARVLVGQLHARGHYLPQVPAADPHWLMMLELFIAGEEKRQVSVSSLCMAAGVPSTTALRYVRTLEDKSVFDRTTHPKDRRICHIRLTTEAKRQIERYLIAVAGGGGANCPLRQPLRPAR
ncbi:MAG: hypothetical protein JWN69_1408 [Alphaproteobacteria bacterium]|nr:hypothetical protein [Alphaproteobacteria bacterium]